MDDPQNPNMQRKISDAIIANDVRCLRAALNEFYYSAKFPTLDEQGIENYKNVCIYSNKSHLLSAFEEYPDWVKALMKYRTNLII